MEANKNRIEKDLFFENLETIENEVMGSEIEESLEILET